jgi:hypothetical protein
MAVMCEQNLPVHRLKKYLSDHVNGARYLVSKYSVDPAESVSMEVHKVVS